MEDKSKVVIQNVDGSTMEVEIVTYLVNDDKSCSYLVYSKGEHMGDNNDEVIYISKIVKDGDVMKLTDISDDEEWSQVQRLLKKIANA